MGKHHRRKAAATPSSSSPDEETWPSRTRSGVMLEAYLPPGSDTTDPRSDNGEGVSRTKSLTDDDLEDLKGCLDLGFGFSYDEIPELCNTLPALELCYSMSQRFNEDADVAQDGPSAPVANWRISSPGDHPDDVKARLRYWAQAVACTVKLCR